MDYGAAVSQKGYDVKTCADRFLVFSSSFQTLKIYDVYSVSSDVPAEDFYPFSASAATDTFTASNHGLINGDQIEFSDYDGLPSPIAEDTIYYVINAATNTFKVSLTEGGSAVNLTTNYSGSDSEVRPLDKIITITHNLGYFAPYIVIYNENNGDNAYYNSYYTTRNYENYLEIEVSQFVGYDTAYFTVYLFLNDFSSISQETIKIEDNASDSSDDYGIRISKNGYDVKTCDDVDCVLSSSYYNQIIHKQGHQPHTSGIMISHDLGYVPNYLAFIKPTGEDYITNTDAGGFRITSVNENYLFFKSEFSAEVELYYIIFKDKII